MKTKKLDKRTIEFNKKIKQTKQGMKKLELQQETIFAVTQFFTSKNIMKGLKSLMESFNAKLPKVKTKNKKINKL